MTKAENDKPFSIRAVYDGSASKDIKLYFQEEIDGVWFNVVHYHDEEGKLYYVTKTRIE